MFFEQEVTEEMEWQ